MSHKLGVFHLSSHEFLQTCPKCQGTPDEDSWKYHNPKSPEPLDNYRICDICGCAWKFQIKEILSKSGLLKIFRGYSLISIEFFHKLFFLHPDLYPLIFTGDGRLSTGQTIKIEDYLGHTINSYSLVREGGAFITNLLGKSRFLRLHANTSELCSKKSLRDVVKEIKDNNNKGKYVSGIDPLFLQVIDLVAELQKRGTDTIKVRTIRTLLKFTTEVNDIAQRISGVLQRLEKAKHLTIIDRNPNRYQIKPEFSQKVKNIKGMYIRRS